MAEGGQCYCLSQDDVITFLTTKPYGYHWPSKTCLLMMVKDRSGQFLNAKFYGEPGSGSHAEKPALAQIQTYIKHKIAEQLDILFIQNYSPCDTCKDAIIQCCADNQDDIVSFRIYFSGLYQIGPMQDLIRHPQIKICNINGGYWKSLILAKDQFWMRFWDGPPENVSDWVETMKQVLADRGLAEFKIEGKKKGWEEPISSTMFLDARKKCDDDNSLKLSRAKLYVNQ